MFGQYQKRSMEPEIMDDLQLGNGHLDRALRELRWVNGFLGGYSALRSGLDELIPAGGAASILDLGTGSADIPEQVVRWGKERGQDLRIVALDANPYVVSHASAALDERLQPDLRARVSVRQGDALDTGFSDGSFDVVTASLFAHHLDEDSLVGLLLEMWRLARRGIVVNDLHRHPAAYHGFRLLSNVAGASHMVRHDGPLSVLRAFRRNELLSAAAMAGLENVSVSWRWAFRWLMLARRVSI